jgi:hypothetical protein
LIDLDKFSNFQNKLSLNSLLENKQFKSYKFKDIFNDITHNGIKN